MLREERRRPLKSSGRLDLRYSEQSIGHPNALSYLLAARRPTVDRRLDRRDRRNFVIGTAAGGLTILDSDGLLRYDQRPEI